MESKERVKHLSVRIGRTATEAYEFLSQPENFPRWASGMGGSLRRQGADWVVETPEGTATVRFSEQNSYGVRTTRDLRPRSDLRAAARGRRAMNEDLVLTLFRQPDISDEKFGRSRVGDARPAHRETAPRGAMNPAPGYKKYPHHRIETKPAGVRVRVKFKGEVIADTRDAIALEEAMGGSKSTVAPVVYYIPRKDAKMDRLVRTSHRTHCPFKGDASYFSFKEGPENAVWSRSPRREGPHQVCSRSIRTSRISTLGS